MANPFVHLELTTPDVAKAKEFYGKLFNWTFTDTDQRYALTLQNCALTYLAGRHAETADATVQLERATLNRIILKEVALPDAMSSGLVRIEGNLMRVAELFGLLDEFSMAFEVVEPLTLKS